ncbi:hypothetical protein [Candidatus Liberibacter brunswickensis]|uniref:hypothetical protein n=1 Tax=Candidatus Liberibacter brunswickensis TaxID=1968796 RepID=UPI002FE3FA95
MYLRFSYKTLLLLTFTTQYLILFCYEIPACPKNMLEESKEITSSEKKKKTSIHSKRNHDTINSSNKEDMNKNISLKKTKDIVDAFPLPNPPIKYYKF